MATIKKRKRKQSNKRLVRMWKIETLVHCWWEWKMVQPLWKIVWSFFKDPQIEFPHDPAIPFPSVYPKELKAGF